jgi:hypothetical protein
MAFLQKQMEWQHWGVIDCIWSFPYINEELFVAVGAHVLVRGHTRPGSSVLYG